jgi:rpsU-divergently transcribed protein
MTAGDRLSMSRSTAIDAAAADADRASAARRKPPTMFLARFPRAALARAAPSRSCRARAAATASAGPSAGPSAARHRADIGDAGAGGAAASGTTPPPPPPRSEAERLLDAILPHVAARGWSDAAIGAALDDLGWSPAAAGLLPRGPASAVDALVARFNADLAAALAADDGRGGDPGARAAHAIRARIEMAAPYRSSWAQALRLQAQPRNVQTAAVASARLADEIAHYAGYRSPDVRGGDCVPALPSLALF